MIYRKITYLYQVFIFITLSAFIGNSPLFGQKADSLLRELNSSNSHTKFDLLILLGQEFIYSDQDSSLKYFNLALDHASYLKDNSLRGHAFTNLSNYYYERGKMEMALENARNSLNAYQSDNNDEGIADALNSLGICYSELGLNELAMEAYIEALRKYESINSDYGEALTSLNLGTLLDVTDEDSLALSYYRRSADLYKNMGREADLPDNYNNIADIFLKNDELDSALFYYQLSYDLFNKYDIKSGLAVVDFNLGNLYLKQKNYSNANHHFSKALAQFEFLEDSLGMGYVFVDLAELSLDQEDYTSAKIYLDKVYTCLINYPQNELLKFYYWNQVNYFEKTGNPVSALDWSNKLHQLGDSLNRINDIQTIKTLQWAYQTEKKDAEIQRLQLARERDLTASNKKDLIRKGLLIIMFIMVVCSVFLFIINNQRRKVNQLLNEQRKNLIEKNKRITDQQKELREINEKLLEEKKVAERANEVKDQFLSVISHELRTPLNAVIGFTKFLREDKHLPSQVENLSGLESSAQILLSLINNLLDLSKLESGGYLLEKKPFNLIKNTQEVINIFQGSINQKNLKIELIHDQNIPEYVNGDAHALRQILINLVGNAVKFTSKGSIKVEIKNLGIYNENQVRIGIDVSDTGIGISPQQQGLIFNKFQQADSSIRRVYGGTGMGLAITKSLVDNQGGTITVSSVVGEGSVFSLGLPYEIAVPETKEKPKNLISTEEGSVKILIAEDNEMNIKVLHKFLMRWGYPSDIAANGRIAYEKASEKDYDLIFMDIQMPEMDGFEAATKIKKGKPQTKIIAITADVNGSILEKIKLSGMDNYLPKPFDPENLRKMIEEVKKLKYPKKEKSISINPDKAE